jgi:1-acyl-sn-glycerol-3-phosphate acyltransferase
MVNHQSMFDILVLQGRLFFQFRWLAKQELFRIPIFGPAMARAGYVSIDRSNARSAHKSLLAAARKVARGVSVVVFPEGSRSRDGEIGSFKPGGFHLAFRAGRPIVPVVICGTHSIMPKGSLRISPGRVTVSINSPIETASYAKGDKSRLMETVRSVMKEDLERIRVTQPRGLP